MNELYNIFLNIKKNLNSNSSKKLELIELVNLIIKENKTQRDYEKLSQIQRYTDLIIKSLSNLGTDIMKLSSLDSDIMFVEIEKRIRTIILNIDQFIDGLSAIINTIDFKDNRIEIKQVLAYLKSLRGIIISRTNDYRIKLDKKNHDISIFIIFLAETIDTILSQAYNLRLFKIKNAIGKILPND
jgi:hypothetical protein